jgi:hypothetical protein
VKTQRSGIHVQLHPEGRSLIGPLTVKTRVCGITQQHHCFYRERTNQGRAKSGLKLPSIPFFEQLLEG